MADINHIITLGIGTPADIEHFILDGLNADAGGGTPGSGVNVLANTGISGLSGGNEDMEMD